MAGSKSNAKVAPVRVPSSQSPTPRTAGAPTPPSDLDQGRRIRLISLQQQVLDVYAVCSILATSMDPQGDEDSIRLLRLAELRLQEVSDGIERIANEIVGVPHGQA